jgi:hypothetical protein
VVLTTLAGIAAWKLFGADWAVSAGLLLGLLVAPLVPVPE